VATAYYRAVARRVRLLGRGGSVFTLPPADRLATKRSDLAMRMTAERRLARDLNAGACGAYRRVRPLPAVPKLAWLSARKRGNCVSNRCPQGRPAWSDCGLRLTVPAYAQPRRCDDPPKRAVYTKHLAWRCEV
jgi:hypothetical protein